MPTKADTLGCARSVKRTGRVALKGQRHPPGNLAEPVVSLDGFRCPAEVAPRAGGQSELRPHPGLPVARVDPPLISRQSQRGVGLEEL